MRFSGPPKVDARSIGWDDNLCALISNSYSSPFVSPVAVADSDPTVAKWSVS